MTWLVGESRNSQTISAWACAFCRKCVHCLLSFAHLASHAERGFLSQHSLASQEPDLESIAKGLKVR